MCDELFYRFARTPLNLFTNFLRENDVSTIMAANMEMELDDFAAITAIAAIAQDEGVRLAR